GSAKIEKKPAENSRLFLKPKTQRSKPFFPRRGGRFFFQKSAFFIRKSLFKHPKALFSWNKRKWMVRHLKRFPNSRKWSTGLKITRRTLKSLLFLFLNVFKCPYIQF
ncbi:hypothetical protein ACWHAR_19395, partial [Bacillus sp. LR--39]